VSRQVVAEEADQKALRVSLDVNIWVAHQLAIQSGRAGGAATELVNMVLAMECEAGPIQLVMSWEMIATLEDVLTRLNFDSQSISDFSASLILLMRSGPEAFDPYLLPESGRHLPMKDEEDAGVLASAIAARIDLLVTNNLDDFQTKDAERIQTREITLRKEPPKQLFSIPYERNDGVSIVIAHPIDALAWLHDGIRPTPETIRGLSSNPTSKP
jgi:predicted nucleic acid-binding protein